MEWADSYTTDAHKWLLTGFDATLFWVADRAALTGALAILPEYLRNAATDAGAVVDYRDWQVPLGRRFRSLKLWFVLRWYGAEGLRAHIRSTVALAQELAGWAEADDRFDVLTPHPLSLVCLTPRWPTGVDADVASMTLLERLNDGGEVFLTHTTVRGPWCCGWPSAHPPTTRAHVERVWALLRENHDWLAADFAAQAAERAREAAARVEEQSRVAAERAEAEAEGAQQQADAGSAGGRARRGHRARRGTGRAGRDGGPGLGPGAPAPGVTRGRRPGVSPPRPAGPRRTAARAAPA